MSQPDSATPVKSINPLPNNPTDWDTPIHVMIDLETYALTPDAVILSIGAVKFDSKSLYSEFYIELDPEQQKTRATNPNTVKWWSEQPIPVPIGLASLDYALNEFRRWYNYSSVVEGVWCKGTDFDISILNHAYRNHTPTGQVPWKYSLARDCRTLFKLFPDLVPERDQARTLHNSLEDAKYQAQAVQAILNTVRTDW